MNTPEQAETEARTLAKYINGKLGITLTQYSQETQTPVSTLNHRWKSEGGKLRVMQSVKCFYMERFDEL